MVTGGNVGGWAEGEEEEEKGEDGEEGEDGGEGKREAASVTARRAS